MATKTVAITKKPAAPGGGGPAPGGPAGPDTTPPSATLAAPRQKLKAVIAKGLALRAACGEPCTFPLQLVLDKATAKKLKLGRKAIVIGRLTRSVDGTATFKVKLTAKARKALKKAKHLKLAVRATATDAAGNAAAMTKRVRL